MINQEVKKLVDSGMSVRQAYRKVESGNSNKKKKAEFNYEANTPKGEWV